MKAVNGHKYIGFFDPQKDEPEILEDIEQYRRYNNMLNKGVVVQHIESCPLALACAAEPACIRRDIFTGERLADDGFYDDGCYRISRDFIHYYTHYDIGIPPEYERYLVEEIGIR